MNKATLQQYLENKCRKSLDQASREEMYRVLHELVQEEAVNRAKPVQGRKLYYISAEFLIGKLLSNNLLNLELYEPIQELLQENGHDLAAIEECENEPGLGNGGLGRLAACFLDSLASLNLPGDGIGLRYHCGLFRQDLQTGSQKELPDFWLNSESWAKKTARTYPVQLADKTYQARLYQIAVTGYQGRTNQLNLFDLDSVSEALISQGIQFDQGKIDQNLTLFLYPDDSTEVGRKLRIYQQYFMVSSGAQYILEDAVARGSNYHDLADYVAIQINDTHPSLVIPELIRLLLEQDLSFAEAVEIVTQTCAYTNHTILAEALEKWPLAFLQEITPQLVPIIRKLNEIAQKRSSDPLTAIVDANDLVHMAHMDIHFTHSTNGVAALHTEILKNSELEHFYKLYPEKFNNKTNGITFRRWLVEANKSLTQAIKAKIGSAFLQESTELTKLAAWQDDTAFLQLLQKIKQENKLELTRWIATKQGIQVNPQAMFSIQSKRLHEYKRQQLNLLYLVHQLLEIRSGHLPTIPLASWFGAKAAPAYTLAKDIIHALLTLAKVIASDAVASQWLQLIFVENYNVSAAAKMIPACDLSEQISLASKEASGTGNMKFMLNGGITLGTMDGANVEIAERVGPENIYIFGQSAKQVITTYANASYEAKEWYEGDPNIRRAIDFLLSEEMLQAGDATSLRRLHQELTTKDWFQTLPDFNAYLVRKNQALADYAQDPLAWQKKCLLNIAQAGFFSSDRTIREYNRAIWHLGE